MKDSLKELVNQQRQDFEHTPPDLDDIWQGVEQGLIELQDQRKGRRFPFLRLAAALALLMAASLAWFTLDHKSGKAETYSYISPELAESQAYYGQMISEQMALVIDNQNKIDPEILADLARIDQDLDLLLQDLEDDADNEEVVMAIIKLYRTKLFVLTDILEELQQEDESNETII